MNIEEHQTDLIPMSLEEQLLFVREKRRLSLEEIGLSIKAKPEILAAIEAGETAHIPAVYLKGYIRSYARYLGIDAAVVEHHLQAETRTEPAVQSIFTKGPPRNSGDRWIKATSYVLASAVVIALVWQFTTEAVRFSQGDPLLRPVQQNNLGPATNSTNGADPVAESSDTSKRQPSSHLRASIASLSTENDMRESRPSSVAESAWAAISKNESGVGETGLSATEGDFLAGASSGVDRIEITTSADSWVEIFDGQGETVEMDLLRAGSHRNYTANPPLQLLLGRASSMEVFRNGEKIDLAPFTRGNVARFTLREEAQETESINNELTPPDQG